MSMGPGNLTRMPTETAFNHTKRMFPPPVEVGDLTIEAYGHFPAGRVVVHWFPEKRRNMTDPELEERIDREWRLAVQANPRIFAGRLCRMIHLEEDGGSLMLTLGITDYRELVGTNVSNLEWLMRQHPDDYADYGNWARIPYPTSSSCMSSPSHQTDNSWWASVQAT